MIDQGNGFVSAAAMNLEVGDRFFIGNDSMTTVYCGARQITLQKPMFTLSSPRRRAPPVRRPLLSED